MYRQYDGYPSCHGMELYEFLKDFSIINGIGNLDENKKYANGAGCIAAQLVSHFKTDVEGIYLYPTDSKDVWEEFVYEIHLKFLKNPTKNFIIDKDDVEIHLKNLENSKEIFMIVKDGFGNKLFEGDLNEFKTFCEHD